MLGSQELEQGMEHVKRNWLKYLLALIVIIVVLVAVYYIGKSSSEGFVSPYASSRFLTNNFNTGGNNPQWEQGSRLTMSHGFGGSDSAARPYYGDAADQHDQDIEHSADYLSEMYGSEHMCGGEHMYGGMMPHPSDGAIPVPLNMSGGQRVALSNGMLSNKFCADSGMNARAENHMQHWMGN